jgi:hypothetical protein
VTLGDLLFLELTQKLLVKLYSAAASGRGVVLKYSAHVMQEPRRRNERGRASHLVPMVNEELSVLIALLGGAGKP